jgi:hypothetical protein
MGRAATSPVRLPTLGGHDLSGRSGDGPDDRSDTGEQERGENPISAFSAQPEESISKSCPQPGSEQGQADDSSDHRHGFTSLLRDQSIGIRRLTLHCKVKL